MLMSTMALCSEEKCPRAGREASRDWQILPIPRVGREEEYPSRSSLFTIDMVL